MSKVYYNKKIHDDQTPLLRVSNSAFLFGQSVFSSGLIVDEKVLYLDEHLERTFNGVKNIFNIEIDIIELKNAFEMIAVESHGVHRFRLTFFIEERLNFLITLDQKNLTCSNIVAKSINKTMRGEIIPAEIKMGLYANELYLKNKIQEDGYNDVLFVTNEESILEFSTGNIILANENEIATPPIKGIFPGIIRAKLLENCNVKEREINIKEIVNYEYVFLTNSVKGLVAVESIDDQKFKINNNLLNELRAKI